MLTTETITAEYAGKLAGREKYADKSTYGKLLIIAGSKGMAGAAYLAGLAAFRSGIGMVRFLGPEENRGILQTLLPEAMYNVENFSDVLDSGTAPGSPPTGHDHLQYRSAAGTAPGSPASDPAGTEAFRKAFDWATHIIIGPGLSTDETAAKRVRELFAADLSSKQLVIIDADALNLIASGAVSLPPSGANIIITPHPGEMARLSGLPVREILDRPLDTAHTFSEKYGVTAVLKNAETYIASPDGRIAVNTSGHPALAKAGSGDVLTGIIAGVSAVTGAPAFEAAAAGTYIHGLAGCIAAQKHGPHGILSRDTAGSIPAAFRSAVKIAADTTKQQIFPVKS